MTDRNASASGRKRRSDGERSRTAILGEAARLATDNGLGGLSLARLAEAAGISKSGLFAHFGSKEDLQLATVDTAADIFRQEVLDPAAAAPDAIERLHRLYEGYLRYVETEVFPGGCFFASALAEVNTQPGPVRDHLVAFFVDWLGQIEAAVRDVQAEGGIDACEDAAQLAFEIEAALLLANAQYVVARTHEPIERAERAIAGRLASKLSSTPRSRSRGSTRGGK
jgi:AcrR family transcriptional regulator